MTIIFETLNYTIAFRHGELNTRDMFCSEINLFLLGTRYENCINEMGKSYLNNIRLWPNFGSNGEFRVVENPPAGLKKVKENYNIQPASHVIYQNKAFFISKIMVIVLGKLNKAIKQCKDRSYLILHSTFVACWSIRKLKIL